MFDLSGKTALITGASGGIGGAIARALHKQGATVTLSGTLSWGKAGSSCKKDGGVAYMVYSHRHALHPE